MAPRVCPPAPHRPPRSAAAAGDHYLAACLPPAGPPQPGHRLIIPQVPAAALCACAALTSEQDMAVPSAPLPPARACARPLAPDPTALCRQPRRRACTGASEHAPARVRARPRPPPPPPRPAARQRDGACAERPAVPSNATAQYLARTCPRLSAAGPRRSLTPRQAPSCLTDTSPRQTGRGGDDTAFPRPCGAPGSFPVPPAPQPAGGALRVRGEEAGRA